MITLQHIEEGLSRAYVAAVVAHAGAITYTPTFDYGVDGVIARVGRTVEGRYSDDGVKFDFQLKASTRWQVQGDSLRYALEAKTYNGIVRRNALLGNIPLLLLLMCLPEEYTNWLENDEERLLMRKCCYWAKLMGEPTGNAHSVMINIPREQLLTPENLVALLDEFSKRG